MIKAAYLGLPPGAWPSQLWTHARSLLAISYADVMFAAVLWLAAHGLVAVLGRVGLGRITAWAFVVLATLSSLVAVVNIGLFGVVGGFLTYALLQTVGDVRMVRSSVGAHLTAPVVSALIGVPLAHLAAVIVSYRGRLFARTSRRAALGAAVVALLWVVGGQLAFSQDWATRREWRVAQSSHWVLLSSWWQRNADRDVRLTDAFTDDDLSDFEPLGLRPVAPRSDVRKASARASRTPTVARPPPNVVLLVLESVGARWTSLYGSGYDTTPTLLAESAHAVVFENFYAHIGRSSNSLAAILLSTYPKLGFRDMTDEYPALPGTSVTSVFKDRGYRTAFVTPSALSWAGWDRFLTGRGFDEVRDEQDLACGERVSSWGVEDRCMVDDIIHQLDASDEPANGEARDNARSRDDRPLFIMGWTQQTHHPYEPSPGVPLLPLVRDPVIDDYAFSRYLNVLRETDRQIGRLFDAVRRAGQDRDTIIVITGDHGQAFGYPHDVYMQGRSVYEEDVRVPLVIWAPRLYAKPVRSAAIGSHIDLAPTLAEIAGLLPAAEWQGRNLFDPRRSPRAYFYVAEDEFMLGMREDRWKYIVNMRDGGHELYDLSVDPGEQRNVAPAHLDVCTRLRRRLAAWAEANRRQYAKIRPDGSVRLDIRAVT